MSKVVRTTLEALGDVLGVFLCLELFDTLATQGEEQQGKMSFLALPLTDTSSQRNDDSDAAGLNLAVGDW